METETQINKGRNAVYLYGMVVSEPTAPHEFYGEGFYELQMSVKRLSSIVDIIPIVIPKNILEREKIILGSHIAVLGEFRSFNKIENNRSRLMLSVFTSMLDTEINEENPNTIELSGYICKMPVYRTTPFNREIADLLIAVNREQGKTDYLPAIAWGRNARLAKTMSVGDQINITGRIQSREYQKKLDNGMTETRVAYEISINQMSNENFESQLGETNFIVESRQSSTSSV
jgi:single-stranded DNA-binding protein